MFDNKNHARSPLRARLWRCAIGAVLFAIAFQHASRGLDWSRSFHPDEIVIAKWMHQTRESGYVTDRAYPGGWFVMINVWQRAKAVRDSAARLWRGGDPVPFRAKSVMQGRRFNLRLFALAVLFLYLAALETGACPAAAAFGALLLAVHPFPLEHVHYCETDMAVPFALCLSGWLAMRAIRLGSRVWYVAAMFATGFAIACKYTLLPAILWPIAVAPAVVRGEDRRLARTATLAAAGIGAALVGFLVGTPALWMDFEFFTRSMREVSRKTYAEGARALGKAFGSAWTRCTWRAGTFAHELARMGIAPLVFFGAALAVWIRIGRRGSRAVFPLFLLVFLPYAVFLMPWIRNQETLPVLPPLCVCAAVAVDWSARTLARKASGARCRVVAAALLVLACGAFSHTYCDGRRILSSFSRKDTRVALHDWLRDCVGADVHLVYDRYTQHAVFQNPLLGDYVPGFDQHWPRVLHTMAFQTNHIRYAVRNAAYTGRRVNDPHATQRNQAFSRDCLLLRTWKIVPGCIRTTTFSQPDLELWAIPDSGDFAESVFLLKGEAPDIPVILDRPVAFPPGDVSLYAAGEPHALGPVRGMCVDGSSRGFHPVPFGDSLVVFREVAGPADGTVCWSRLASPKRRSLSEGRVFLFTMSGAALRHRAVTDVLPGARVRLLDASSPSTVCAVWPVADRAEAARALRRGGDPSAALALLRGASSQGDAEKAEAFLAAVDAGEAPDPAWKAAARDLFAALGSALSEIGEGKDGFRIRGVPLFVERDFANLRLSNVSQMPDGTFPILLPAGTYRATFIAPPDAVAPESGLWLEGQTVPAVSRVDAKNYTWWSATIDLPQESLLRVRTDTRPGIDGGSGCFRELELSWDPAEQLPLLADELCTALSKN